jgi:hypothetical protein
LANHIISFVEIARMKTERACVDVEKSNDRSEREWRVVFDPQCDACLMTLFPESFALAETLVLVQDFMSLSLNIVCRGRQVPCGKHDDCWEIS